MLKAIKTWILDLLDHGVFIFFLLTGRYYRKEVIKIMKAIKTWILDHGVFIFFLLIIGMDMFASDDFFANRFTVILECLVMYLALGEFEGRAEIKRLREERELQRKFDETIGQLDDD